MFNAHSVILIDEQLAAHRSVIMAIRLQRIVDSLLFRPETLEICLECEVVQEIGNLNHTSVF